jgi:hypothetical protein
MGFAVHEVFNGGGNPYGTSYTSDHRVDGPDETTLMVARAQGARLARVAAAKRMRVESLPAELEERLLEAFRGWRRTRGRPSDGEDASETSPSNEQEN